MTDVETRKIDLSQTIISFKILYSAITGENIGDNSLKDVVFKVMMTKEISKNLDNLNFRKQYFLNIQDNLKAFNPIQLQKNRRVEKLFQTGFTICLTLSHYDDIIIKNKPISEVLKLETEDFKKEILEDTSMYKKIDISEYPKLMDKFINNIPFDKSEIGLFITKSGDEYIAIDNSFGDFFTKRFPDENSAINFLLYQNVKMKSIEADFKVEIEDDEESEENEL